jgi:hypothetical protein
LAAALVAAGAVAACSSNDTASPGTPDAEAVCPATLDATAGHACAVEGLACSPTYACGLVQATATCACEGGFFGCKDVTGRALAAGDVPACPSFDAGAGVCPSTERAAAVASCTEVGLLCTYPSACPAARLLDQCQCRTTTTTAGVTAFRFDCGPPCPPADAAVPVVDASSPADSSAPGVDGNHDETGSDATVDSPSDSPPDSSPDASDAAPG